jgi:HAD superfamily hydrolase (TIGR01484 family)
MRLRALASDYDGTLADDGRVDGETVAALERFVRSGRRLLLVTGREVGDLLAVMDRLDLFDRVVAENGALLYRPAERERVPLAEPPPEAFVARLRERGVSPLSTGTVIVGTREQNRPVVLETIRELGLELAVILNKGAVMVLPSGVDKAYGLAVALAELGVSARDTVGVGDAENDHTFLAACECAVAVANALPAVKERCDLVTERDHGGGVVELIDRIIQTDLFE